MMLHSALGRSAVAAPRISRQNVAARHAVVLRVAQAEQPSEVGEPVAAVEELPRRQNAPRARQGTPRPRTPRPGTPRPMARTSTPRPIPEALIRDDTMTVQLPEANDLESLAKNILAHQVLNSPAPAPTPAEAEAPAAGTEEAGPQAGKLRIVALGSRAITSVFEALAIANEQLAAAGEGMLLQASVSARRPPQVPLLTALEEGLGAFVFVSKVPAASLPPLAPQGEHIRFSRNTLWRKSAGMLQGMLLSPAGSVVVSGVGFGAILNMFRAVMFARNRLLSGTARPMGSPANNSKRGNQQEGAEQDGGASSGDEGADGQQGTGERADFALVALRGQEKVNSTVSLSVTRLQLVRCAPPPAREPRGDNEGEQQRRGRQGGRQGGNNNKNNNNNNAGGRGRRNDTVTVSAKEWNSLKKQIDTMTKQHQDLLTLLSDKLGGGESK